VGQQLIRDVSINTAEIKRAALRNHEKEIDALKIDAKIAMEAFWEDRELWPERPRVAEYCGLEEARGRYYICDRKNSDGRCLEYRAATRAELEKQCVSCVYREEPTQERDDRRLHIARARLDAVSRTHYKGMLYGIANESRDKAAASLELAAQRAFSSASVRAGDERYFSVCARTAHEEGPLKMSTLCAWLNPDDRCPFWSPASSAEQHREVDKWTPQFELGGFCFSQGYEAESPVLAVHAARFVNLLPASLRYALEDLRVGDTCSLACIAGASVVLRENERSRDYYVRRPGHREQFSKELFPIRRS
jgi:hypothetical protein